MTEAGLSSGLCSPSVEPPRSDQTDCMLFSFWNLLLSVLYARGQFPPLLTVCLTPFSFSLPFPQTVLKDIVTKPTCQSDLESSGTVEVSWNFLIASSFCCQKFILVIVITKMEWCQVLRGLPISWSEGCKTYSWQCLWPRIWLQSRLLNPPAALDSWTEPLWKRHWASYYFVKYNG